MTPSPSKHTPTPWDVDAMGYLRGPNSENILEVKANAAFIVEAVNNYDSLKKLNGELLEYVEKLSRKEKL